MHYQLERSTPVTGNADIYCQRSPNKTTQVMVAESDILTGLLNERDCNRRNGRDVGQGFFVVVAITGDGFLSPHKRHKIAAYQQIEQETRASTRRADRSDGERGRLVVVQWLSDGMGSFKIQWLVHVLGDIDLTSFLIRYGSAKAKHYPIKYVGPMMNLKGIHCQCYSSMHV